MIDRIESCLLGGALGDALGSSLEGAAACPSQLRIGSITDDTELTLATCEAILARGRVDPEAIARTLASWYQQGRFHRLGSATKKALVDLVHGQHWALSGASGEHAAGNGAAIRIAPLAFVIDPRTDAGRRAVRDVARITHRSDEAYAGALAVCVAVHCALAGIDPSSSAVFDALLDVLPDTAVRDRVAWVAAHRDDALPAVASELGTSGHVISSVPLALVTAAHASRSGIEAALTALVREGGDTDSNASMAGQIAGAFGGRHALPRSWLDVLTVRKSIETVAARFEA